MPLRGFWKRWILLLFTFIIGIVIIILVTKKPSNFNSGSRSNFIWLDLTNVTHLKVCRNSKQGPKLIADEKGYVCRIDELLYNGCCNPRGNSTEQYACLTCKVNKCCRIYENCVSCCLQPQKKKLLEKVLLHVYNARNPVLALVKDTFELCLHKCRTSSISVKQENMYRDGVYKYCYGLDAPRVEKLP